MNQLLFVDDEEKILDGLKRSLRAKRDEWNCHFALSVDAALELCETIEFDVIVSDINMPVKTGLDLVRALRAQPRTEHVPILMLTGNTEAGVRMEALEIGATDFLQKPVDHVELLARIHNFARLNEFQTKIRHHNEHLEAVVKERTNELAESRREVVCCLAKAAEERDHETGNHIVRVGLVSKLLAGYMGLNDKDQEAMFLAAVLHDVGKIGIPDAILLKRASLTKEERNTMEEHCAIGARILGRQMNHILESSDCSDEADLKQTSESDLLNLAAEIALAHHEKWDGSGYPNCLRGEQIPISARIVAVADVYDALRSVRPYKNGFSAEKTLEILKDGAGSHFDPRIIEEFSSHFDEIEELTAPMRDDGEIIEVSLMAS